MDNENKELLISKLNNIVSELISNHGVTHENIKKEIFKTVKEQSDKLPKLQVLYNKAYGGFGYSEDFMDYKEDNIEPIDEESNIDLYGHRVDAVKRVEKYGAYCKEKYPLIVQMISIYKQYCLGDVFSNAESYKYYRSNIEKFNKYIDQINSYENFGELEYKYTYISYDLFKTDEFHKYTKDSLLLLVNKEKSKTEKQLTSYILFNEGKVGKDICELIYSEIEKKNKYKEDMWLREEKKYTFIDAVIKYGQDNIEIWNHQPYYNTTAMKFLVKYSDMLVNNSVECTDMDIGLLCANGKYCKLTVGEAPQLLSWKIGEYDGLESIVVMP